VAVSEYTLHYHVVVFYNLCDYFLHFIFRGVLTPKTSC